MGKCEKDTFCQRLCPSLSHGRLWSVEKLKSVWAVGSEVYEKVKEIAENIILIEKAAALKLQSVPQKKNLKQSYGMQIYGEESTRRLQQQC